MPVVGEATVVVRAITTGVESDIRKAFNGMSSVGSSAGRNLGKSFSDGFNRSNANNVFTKVADGLKALDPGAQSAASAFHSLNREAMTWGTAVGSMLGGISSVISGIVSMAATAAGAIPSLIALGNAVAAIGIGGAVAKLALGGIGGALQKLNSSTGGGGGGGGGGGADTSAQEAAAAKALARARADAAAQIADAEKNLARVIADNRDTLVQANNDVRKAQLDLNDAIKEGQDQIKQLGFDAEDAALNEKKAALDLEKARANLAAVQDLPPNSRARQEAELAYQEADLNLRKAKSASQDLNAQQDKLAKTGVAGTQVVIDAQNALAEAQQAKAKAVVDALQRQQDAQDALTKAQQNAQRVEEDGADKAAKIAAAGAAGGGGVDPFAGLNAAQIAFVKFLQSLKPLYDQLKLAASEAFLPPLQTAIQLLADKMFPVLLTGVTQVGTAMGQAAISIATAMTSGNNLAKLGVLFQTTSKLIATFGQIAGSAWGIALSLLNASAPAAQRFADFVAKAADSFDKFLDAKAATGELQAFFDRSANIMAQLGSIFGNVFKGIGAIIEANFGPDSGGQAMLDWAQNATQKFAEIGDTVEKKVNLKKFFQETSDNAQHVLSALGAFLKVFIDIGTNPAIGQTADIMKSAAPAVESIAKKAIEAGPSLAALFVTLVKIVDKMQDSAAAQVFFNTLKGVADAILAALNNPVLNAILTTTGLIFAFASAVGLVGKAASEGFSIMNGAVQGVLKPLGSLVGGLKDVGASFTGAMEAGEGFKGMMILMQASNNKVVSSLGSVGGALGKVFTGPVGIVIGVIAALVAAFIYFYNTSDTFRAQMDAIGQQLMQVLGTAFQQILAAVQPILPVLEGAFQQLMTALAPVVPMLANLIAGLVQALVPIVPVLVSAITGIITAVAPIIPMLINALVPAIVAIINAVLPLVSTLIGALLPAFTQIIAVVAPVVQMLITQLVPVISAILQAVMPLVTTLLGALVPAFTSIMNAVMPLVTTLINALMPVFTSLISAIMPLVSVLLSALMPIIQALAPVLQFLATIIGDVLVFAINVVVGVITFLVDAITAVVNFLLGDGTSGFQSFADFFQTVFQAIGDFWNGLWQGISDFFSGIWNGIVAFVTAYINTVRDIITNVGNFISSVWNGIWGGISSFFGTIWTGIVAYVTTYINTVRNIIQNVINTISSIWNSVWNGISSFFSSIWNGIVNAVRGFGDIFHNIFNGISGFVRDAFSGVLGAVKGPINGIIGLVNSAIRALNGIKVTIPGWVPGIGGQTFGINLPTIPQLAKGGVVQPSPGGSLVNVAEAGKPERVEPLDENGMSKRDYAMLDALTKAGAGSNIQIDVHAAPGQSEEEIAEIVNQKLAFALRKGGLV